MYFADIYKVKRKINAFLRIMKKRKSKEVIEELNKRLNDLIAYKNEIISFKIEGILESNFEFQKILKFCCDFYKEINIYKRKIDKANDLNIINDCLQIRDVKTCKDCSRFNTNICRIILKNELCTAKLINYWNSIK